MAWRESKARQLTLWERKMFKNAPIRVLLREARGLLRLVEGGNRGAIPLLDRILEECEERIAEAVVRDSEYWIYILTKEEVKGR